MLGTLGGYEARRRLVAATGGRDLPIALVEEAVAVFGGFAITAPNGGCVAAGSTPYRGDACRRKVHRAGSVTYSR